MLLVRHLIKRPLTEGLRYSSNLSPAYSIKIGQREVVGFGTNGQPSYVDRPDIPFPAIRFHPVTADIRVLREKEKGDWKKLSIQEKKTLYRASFCQTFPEMQAPTGEWKSVIGWTSVLLSLGIWLHLYIRLYVHEPSKLPDSLKEENRVAQLKRMLAFRIGPVDGLSSKWDYENNTWKK